MLHELSRLNMRYTPIDQIRGFAIAAMIMAHFGLGVWERLGLSGPLLEFLLVIGRFATPMFIAIFGFTLAFAYLGKAKDNPKSIRDKLIKRSGDVFLAAVVVALPHIFDTFRPDDYWGGSLALELILKSYNVLMFYTVAIFSAGLLVAPLSRHPYTLPAVMGAVLVFIGSYLGYDAWPNQGEVPAELLRLLFVSGKYAYFTNFGVTLMLVSLGWYLKNLLNRGEKIGPVILVIGVVMVLCSLSIGRIVGWRHLIELYTNYDAPPQLWYLLTICGTMLIIMSVFDRVRIPGVSFFLEHTGRHPLAIYIAQAFVIPGVTLMKMAAPGLPGSVQTALPLFAFLMYWLFIVMRSGREATMRRVVPRENLGT